MECFLEIFILLFLLLAIGFIWLLRRSNSDRQIIFTELMESRHRVNTLSYDMSFYIHCDIEKKRETRALTAEESALWEKTREIMRQYQAEKKKYDAMFAR